MAKTNKTLEDILDVIVYDNPSTQDEIAEKLGMPYQTYLKSTLKQAMDIDEKKFM